MTDINKVIFCGRLTEGITEKNFGFVGNGIARLTLNVATSRSYKKNNEWVEETSFFEVQVWNKFAESIKDKIYKGMQIAVVGELRQDRWKDNNGNNKSKVYIVADSIQFLGAKKEGGKPAEVSQFEEAFGGEAFPEDNPFGN